MSLEKSIASGKERRKPYRGTARFDKSCRHGAKNPCPYCEGNRTFKNKRNEIKGTD